MANLHNVAAVTEKFYKRKH